MTASETFKQQNQIKVIDPSIISYLVAQGPSTKITIDSVGGIWYVRNGAATMDVEDGLFYHRQMGNPVHQFDSYDEALKAFYVYYKK